MRRPAFLATYLTLGLILATPPAAAAQHMRMGQQQQMGQGHTQDMMRRMNAMVDTMHQRNAAMASRVERAQGPMREHQQMMLRVGQAMEQMAAQMKTMMEGMTHDPDILTDQEMVRAMNQFHEDMSSMMRQMEGPMRALHQMHGR